MIAIMKIDSVDVINLIDSEKTDLRFIPSTRINLNKSELSFYKILFTQDVTAREEPDPDEYIHKSDLPSYYWDYLKKCIAEDNFPTEEELNPENYLLKSQMPLYYWNFSKYALSKPADIEPSSYNNLCNLLQAIPKLFSDNQIFNWSKNPPNEIRFGYNTAASITAQGYYLKNGLSGLTYNKLTPRTDTFTIKASLILPKAGKQMIVNFYNPSNSTDPNTWLLLEKTEKPAIMFSTKRGTLSGSNTTVTLPAETDFSKPINLTLKSSPLDSTENFVDLKVSYVENGTRYTEYNNQYVDISKITTATILEQIGSRVYRNSGATVNTTVSGNKHFLYYEYTNETTGDKTIIKFDDSKIINDKLLVIA